MREKTMSESTRKMRTREEIEQTRDLWLRMATVNPDDSDKYLREAELMRWVLGEGTSDDDRARAEDIVRKKYPELFVIRRSEGFFRDGEILARIDEGDIVYLGRNWIDAAERIAKELARNTCQ